MCLGPCGLYRWSAIKDGAVQWYFDIVNRPNQECGLILANLKIAEDRLLSYSAVLKTKEEAWMCIQPDAEFYYEAETELEQFVKQRRRWINGAFAGYLYMCQNLNLIFSSSMSLFRKIAVLFLMICQVK